MRLNPFSFIFESTRVPHARTLRTTFFQKFKDSFNVVGGIGLTSLINYEKKSLGLYDYATLFIPFVLQNLLLSGAHYSFDNFLQPTFVSTKRVSANARRFGWGVAAAVLFIFSTPLIIARSIVALASAICSTPILAATQYARSVAESKSAHPLAEGMQFILGSSTSERRATRIPNPATTNEPLNLEQFLEQTKVDIEELDLRLTKREDGGGYKLSIQKKHYDGFCPIIHSPKSQLTLEDIKTNLKLHSLFAHNVGNIVVNAEEHNSDDVELLGVISGIHAIKS